MAADVSKRGIAVVISRRSRNTTQRSTHMNHLYRTLFHLELTNPHYCLGSTFSSCPIPTLLPPAFVVSPTKFPAAAQSCISPHVPRPPNTIQTRKQRTFCRIPHSSSNTRHGIPEPLARARHNIARRVCHARDALAQRVGSCAERVAEAAGGGAEEACYFGVRVR